MDGNTCKVILKAVLKLLKNTIYVKIPKREDTLGPFHSIILTGRGGWDGGVSEIF